MELCLTNLDLKFRKISFIKGFGNKVLNLEKDIKFRMIWNIQEIINKVFKQDFVKLKHNTHFMKDKLNKALNKAKAIKL